MIFVRFRACHDIATRMTGLGAKRHLDGLVRIREFNGPIGLNIAICSMTALKNLPNPTRFATLSKRAKLGNARMAQAKGSGWPFMGWIFAGVFAVVAIGQCSKTTSSSYGSIAAASSMGASKYIAARSLNCRSTPSSRSSVVTVLKQGETASIVEENGEWSRLGGASDCWVASRYLAESPIDSTNTPLASSDAKGGTSGARSFVSQTPASSYGESTSSKRSRSTRSNSSAKATSSSRSYQKKHAKTPGTYVYDGGSCPCSGSRVCIGPRGGRYCITSGGNKRYGV
jgi:hypothetical protein